MEWRGIKCSLLDCPSTLCNCLITKSNERYDNYCTQKRVSLTPKVGFYYVIKFFLEISKYFIALFQHNRPLLFTLLSRHCFLIILLLYFWSSFLFVDFTTTSVCVV